MEKNTKIYIPAFLSHLKVLPNGYPLPFFVAIVDGKPDFRLLDAKKQALCCTSKICGICGKKLFKGAYYFISGPEGYANRIASDPPMHRQCAEYSLEACPHLHLQKAHRRENGIERLKEQQMEHIADKPATILLVKADKCELIPHPSSSTLRLIKFRPSSYETYAYDNGILEKVYLST